MFCPRCGVKEDRPVQFCRTCGTDLRAVRSSLEQLDATTASAVAAREEIGRAIAAKIKEAEQISHVGAILPEVKKFLESPAEQRLWRMRAGVLTAAIGLGVTLLFILISLAGHNAIFLTGLGLVIFLIGLGIVINGLWLSVQRGDGSEQSSAQREQDANNSQPDGLAQPRDALSSGQHSISPSSVTEQTTRYLSNELRQLSTQIESRKVDG